MVLKGSISLQFNVMLHIHKGLFSSRSVSLTQSCTRQVYRHNKFDLTSARLNAASQSRVRRSLCCLGSSFANTRPQPGLLDSLAQCLYTRAARARSVLLLLRTGLQRLADWAGRPVLLLPLLETWIELKSAKAAISLFYRLLLPLVAWSFSLLFYMALKDLFSVAFLLHGKKCVLVEKLWVYSIFLTHNFFFF